MPIQALGAAAGWRTGDMPMPTAVPCTVSAWIRWGAAIQLLAQEDGTFTDAWISLYSNGDCYWRDTASNNSHVTAIASASTLALNGQWHYVVAVASGGTSVSYVDGRFAGSVASSNLAGGVRNSTKNLTIFQGQTFPGTLTAVGGMAPQVAHLCAWTIDVTTIPDAMTALLRGVSPLLIAPASVLAYWPFRYHTRNVVTNSNEFVPNSTNSALSTDDSCPADIGERVGQVVFDTSIIKLPVPGRVTRAGAVMQGTGRACPSYAGSVHFKTVSDYWQYGDPASPAWTGTGLTLSAWVKFDTINAADRQTVFVKWVATTNGNFMMVTNANSLIMAAVVTSASAQTQIVTFREAKVGEWTHYCMTQDASAFRIYMNGEMHESSASVRSMPTTTASGFIGKYNGATGSLLGKLSQVGFWTAGLSPDEVRAIYYGQDPLTIQRQNMVHFYPFGPTYNGVDIVGNYNGNFIGNVQQDTDSPVVLPTPLLVGGEAQIAPVVVPGFSYAT